MKRWAKMIAVAAAGGAVQALVDGNVSGKAIAAGALTGVAALLLKSPLSESPDRPPRQDPPKN